MTVPLAMHPIIEQARNEGRVVLTEVESKELLAQAGIAVTPTRLAVSKKDAVSLSREFSFPVVLKIVSPDIVHKSDAGGIRLGLENAAQVEQAYEELAGGIKSKNPHAGITGVSVQPMIQQGVEIIIGMSKDAQFGPVLMFGLGGVWVEILEDVSLRVLPVTRKDAGEMIREIKGYPMLTGYRGQEPVDTKKLEDMLLAVNEFVTANPFVKELDLNPVIASGSETVAVDARIVLEEV
jgi:acyl-CoA synthetase (NDP forming)